MGKATILSGGDDGRYTIEVDLGEEAKATRIAGLNAKIAQKTTQISAAEAALAAVEALVTPARVTLGTATDAYILAVNAARGDMSAAKTELVALEAARKALAPLEATAQSMRIGLAVLRADKVVLQKQLTATQSITATLTQQAWCADLTEDATGEVATIEIPGESDLILIQAAAPAPTSGDGRLVARELQSPEQVYWNAAALPGWQKWRPTYRTGTITALDTENDTADVTLDAATSSAQSLGVNLLDTLSAVPVEYMECNAFAFEVGDRCVVRFGGVDWTTPTVIGFVDNPQPCLPQFIGVEVTFGKEDITPANAVFDRPATMPEEIVTAPDPWCGGVDILDLAFTLGAKTSAVATLVMRIGDAFAIDRPLPDGATIAGVSPIEVNSFENTYDEGNPSDVSTPLPLSGAWIWGIPVDTAPVTHWVEFTGDGTFAIKRENFSNILETFTQRINPANSCVPEMFTEQELHHFYHLTTTEVVASQSFGDYVSSQGKMPTVTVEIGSRSVEYAYSHSTTPRIMVFERVSPGGP